LRNAGRDRDSVRGVRNDVHGAPEDLLRHLREELEPARLELPELLRRGAATVPADRLLEYPGKQQVRVYEELAARGGQSLRRQKNPAAALLPGGLKSNSSMMALQH
jgi:hypothetical protein